MQNIVDVQITRDIAVIPQQAFGVLLFVVEVPVVTSRVNSYENLAEVENDYAVDSPAHVAGQRYFGQQLRPARLKIGQKAPGETYLDALQAVREIDDDWYAIAIESPTGNSSISDYTQSVGRLFLSVSDDLGVLDASESDDYASQTLGKANWRTAVMYHSAPASLPQVAWAGAVLPTEPGTSTWAFKRLSGIATDKLNSAQRAAAQNKRVTVYIAVAHSPLTYEGQTSDLGMFIDVVRSIDWLKNLISTRIFSMLASSPKIPYIGGDAFIEQMIRASLDLAVSRNVIVSNYSVSVPPAHLQSPSDRAARRYRDVNFEVQITGAIHSVAVRGTIFIDGVAPGSVPFDPSVPPSMPANALLIGGVPLLIDGEFLVLE